jgi:hypothetical protein
VRAHVELSPVVKHDLRRLSRGPDRKVVIDALTVGPEPVNLGETGQPGNC